MDIARGTDEHPDSAELYVGLWYSLGVNNVPGLGTGKGSVRPEV
jgi:hypothetical protein